MFVVVIASSPNSWLTANLTSGVNVVLPSLIAWWNLTPTVPTWESTVSWATLSLKASFAVVELSVYASALIWLIVAAANGVKNAPPPRLWGIPPDNLNEYCSLSELEV